MAAGDGSYGTGIPGLIMAHRDRQKRYHFRRFGRRNMTD